MVHQPERREHETKCAPPEPKAPNTLHVHANHLVRQVVGVFGSKMCTPTGTEKHHDHKMGGPQITNKNNPKKPQKGVVFEARLSQNGYGAVSTHLGNSGLSDTRLREDVACQILFDVSTMYTSSDMQNNLYNFGMGMSRPLPPLSPEASASSGSLSVHTEDGPSHNIGSSQNITVQIERGPGLPQSPRGRVWPGSGPKSTISGPLSLMLRSSISGPEIWFPGRISAAL